MASSPREPPQIANGADDDIPTADHWATGPPTHAKIELFKFEHASSRSRPETDPFLIDGVLKPNSLMMIAAADGIGKSHIRRQIGISLAIGPTAPPLFGRYRIEKQCHLLVIDEENGWVEEWESEQAILDGLLLERKTLNHYGLLAYAGLNLEDPDQLQKLEMSLYMQHQENEDLPLVLILDHVSLMVAEEWGKEMKNATKWFLDKINRYPWLTVIFVAHMVKPDRQQKTTPNPIRTLQDVLGNLPRSMTSVAVLSDLGSERLRFEMFKRVPHTSIILARRDGYWRFVAETSITGAASSQTDTLIALITDIQRATADQVAVIMEWSHGKAVELLNKLADDEDLLDYYMDGKRKYYIPKQTDS